MQGPVSLSLAVVGRAFLFLSEERQREIGCIAYRRQIEARCPGLFHFAEWSLGGADMPESIEAAERMGMHLTDFSLAALWRRWLRGKAKGEELTVYSQLESRMAAPDLKVNFLDNHDQPRLMNELLSDGFTMEQAESRLEAGVALLLFWTGVPCLYCGTELAMFTRRRPRGKPWGSDPYNREVMRFPDQPTRLMELVRLLAQIRVDSDLVENPLELESEPERLVLRRGEYQLDIQRHHRESRIVLSQGSQTLWELN